MEHISDQQGRSSRARFACGVRVRVKRLDQTENWTVAFSWFPPSSERWSQEYRFLSDRLVVARIELRIASNQDLEPLSRAIHPQNVPAAILSTGQHPGTWISLAGFTVWWSPRERTPIRAISQGRLACRLISPGGPVVFCRADG